MINDSEFEVWARKAYSKVAFYNFEHPEGEKGVVMTSLNSSPQVLLISGKIIDVSNNDSNIIETLEELVEMCNRLWGSPSIPFPNYQRNQPELTDNSDLNRNNIIEILEYIGDKKQTIYTYSWNIYKIGNKTIKIGKYGIQYDNKYFPYSSKEKIKNLIKGLM